VKEVEWARMSAPQLRNLAAHADALAILPIGALEQHGPHLPVITDTASANAAAVAAARLVADEMAVAVAVLPALWLGLSEHHLPFGGTVSLDYDTLHKILRCIARSLVSSGFARLLIVNGHGGNMDPLNVAVRELAVEFAMPIVACTPWMLAEDELRKILEVDDGVHHACEGEASMMLALMPDCVQRDRFEQAYGNQSHPVNPPGGAQRFYSFAEHAPITGTWGDPRTASAEKGMKFLELQARELAKIIRHPQLWTKPDPVWQAGRGQQTTAGRLE